jgi:SAM-dependent methyltransferase
MDLACGRGEAAVWMAMRGMHVWGVDVSPVAVNRARALAARFTTPDQCRFDIVDLDDGLPIGPSLHVIHCHLFRDARLDYPMVERLAPGGLLAIAVLSEVGHGPGPFRARPGELRAAFARLTILAEGEAGGTAWLLGRRET